MDSLENGWDENLLNEKTMADRHCDVCHYRIPDVLFRTVGVRLPLHVPILDPDWPWEIFVAWTACRACAQRLETLMPRELLGWAYRLQQCTMAEMGQVIDSYRYQFSHFTVPITASQHRSPKHDDLLMP